MAVNDDPEYQIYDILERALSEKGNCLSSISAKFLYHRAAKFKDSNSKRYVELLTEVLGLDPTYSDAILDLYWAYVADGSSDQVFEIALRALDPSFRGDDLRQVLVAALCQQDRLLEARDVLDRMADAGKRNFAIIEYYAPSLERSGHSKEAEAEYLKVVNIDEDYFRGMVKFVTFLVRAGRIDEAFETALQCIAKIDGSSFKEYGFREIYFSFRAARLGRQATLIHIRYFEIFHDPSELATVFSTCSDMTLISRMYDVVCGNVDIVEFESRGLAFDFLTEFLRKDGRFAESASMEQRKRKWEADGLLLPQVLHPKLRLNDLSPGPQQLLEEFSGYQGLFLERFRFSREFIVNHCKLLFWCDRSEMALKILRDNFSRKSRNHASEIVFKIFKSGTNEEKIKAIKSFPDFVLYGAVDLISLSDDVIGRDDVKDLLERRLNAEPENAYAYEKLAAHYLFLIGSSSSIFSSLISHGKRAGFYAKEACRRGTGGQALAQYIAMLATAGRRDEAMSELVEWLMSEGCRYNAVEVLGHEALALNADVLALAAAWMALNGSEVTAAQMLMAAHRRTGAAFYMALAWLIEDATNHLASLSKSDVKFERSDELGAWPLLRYGEEYSSKLYEIFVYFIQNDGAKRLSAELAGGRYDHLLRILGCGEKMREFLSNIDREELSILKESILVLRLTLRAYIDYPNRYAECAPVLTSRLLLYFVLRNDDEWLLEARGICRELFLRGEEGALRLAAQELNGISNAAFLRDEFKVAGELFSALEDVIGYLRKMVGVRDKQELWAQQSHGNALRAAYAQWRQGNEEEAVLTLEKGQATLLGDELSLREIDQLVLPETAANAFRKSLADWNGLLTQRLSGNQSSAVIEKIVQVRSEIEDLVFNNTDTDIYNDGDFLSSMSSESPLVYVCHTAKGGFLALVLKGRIRILDLPSLTDHVVETTMSGYLRDYGRFARACEIAEASGAEADRRELERRLRDWIARLDGTLQWLWREIVGGLIAALDAEGCDRCVIVGGGKLRAVPWAAAHAAPLSTSRAEPAARKGSLAKFLMGRGKRAAGRPVYAIDHAAFTYTPSALALHGARKLAEQTDDAPAALVSVCWLGKGQRGFRQEVEAARPNYGQVRQIFLTDDDDTDQAKGRLREALEHATVLQYSSHGRMVPQAPLDRSGLLLGYGPNGVSVWLTLREIMALRLRLRLAVLSACETALDARTDLSLEAIGLPSALLQCGVAGVIAPLWAVSNTATGHLIARYHALWKPGGDLLPGEALRQAQIWLRDTLTFVPSADRLNLAPRAGRKDPPEVRPTDEPKIGEGVYSDLPCHHPVFWAGFTVTGL